MAEAKRQGGSKEGLRTRVKTSGRTNTLLAKPNLHRAGPGGGKPPSRVSYVPVDSGVLYWQLVGTHRLTAALTCV